MSPPSTSPCPSSATSPSPVALRRVWARRLALGAGAVALPLLGAWAWRDDEMAPAHKDETTPAFIVHKPSIVVRQNGQTLWHFDAAQIEPSPDGTHTLAKEVSNGVLFQRGAPVLSLRASRVALNNATNNLQASGEVVAQTPKQLKVSSSLVDWNLNSKTLICSRPVKAQLRDLAFEAPRLRYNWETGQLQSDAPVELHGTGVVIKAPRLHVSTRQRVLELGGGVSMTFNSHSIRPLELRQTLSTFRSNTP